jgi:hypothetical protein
MVIFSQGLHSKMFFFLCQERRSEFLSEFIRTEALKQTDLKHADLVKSPCYTHNFTIGGKLCTQCRNKSFVPI